MLASFPSIDPSFNAPFKNNQWYNIRKKSQRRERREMRTKTITSAGG